MTPPSPQPSKPRLTPSQFATRRTFPGKSTGQRAWLGVALVVFLATLSSREMWRTGPLIYQDHPVHLAEAYALFDIVLPKQHWITGWDDGDFAGYPLQLYFYQLSFWCIGLLHLVGISLENAYKAAVWLGYAAPLAALVLAGSRLWGGGIGVVLGLIGLSRLDLHWAVFQGTYNTGWGLAILFLFQGYLAKTRFQWTLQKVFPVAAFFALEILAHPYLIVGLGVFLAVDVLTTPKGRMRKDALTFCLAGMVLGSLWTAFFWQPILMTGSWMPPAEAGHSEEGTLEILEHLALQVAGVSSTDVRLVEEAWATKSGWPLAKSLGGVLAGESAILATHLLGMFGLMFLFGGRARSMERHQAKLFLGYTGICLLLGSSYWLSSPAFRNIPVFGMIQGFFSHRFLLLARLGWLMVAGFGLFTLWNLLWRGRWPWIRVAPLLLLGGLVLGTGMWTYRNPARTPGMYRTLSDSPSANQALALLRKLKEDLPGGLERVYCQSTYGNSRQDLLSSHLFALASHILERGAMGGWCKIFLYPNNMPTRSFTHHLGTSRYFQLSDSNVAVFMRTYGCKYLVTCDRKPVNLVREGSIRYFNDDTLDSLVAESELFELLVEEGDYRAYRLKEPVGMVGADPPLAMGMITTWEPGKVVMDLLPTQAPAELTVKIAYHPYWQATVNGQKVKLHSNPDGLISFPLTREGTCHVVLRYSSFPVAGVLLTLVGGLMGGLLWFWREKEEGGKK